MSECEQGGKEQQEPAGSEELREEELEVVLVIKIVCPQEACRALEMMLDLAGGSHWWLGQVWVAQGGNQIVME